MGRFLQDFYSNIRLLIVGPCKSAGTLVTLAAHELAFAPFGELGPLDIQVTKKDDLMSVGSGLDTLEAMAILETQALSTFKRYFFDILQDGEGAISTTTAAEIATRLVSGLIGPLAAQIDPQKMGEMQRMISIAKAYGERLGLHNLKEGALNRLVRTYTSHSFIIDFKEARDLFVNVSKATQDEFVVTRALHHAGACVLVPSRETMVHDVRDLAPIEREEKEDGENEAAKRDAGRDRDTSAVGEGESGESRSTEGKPNGAPGAKRRKRNGAELAL